MGIPALDRGLEIIGALLISPSPLKYSDLKNTIDGISDSSLNRLIVSLLDSNYIEKSSDGRYVSGSRLLKWGEIITGRMNSLEKIQMVIDNIVEKTEESAALAAYNEDRIEILASKSAENSISIISPGNILHYEADHAAALAIMDTLSVQVRKKTLKNEFSKINDEEEWREGVTSSRYNDRGFVYYFDESKVRMGISRLAIPLIIENNPCALFICAPSVRLVKKLDKYLNILKNEVNRLKWILSI